MHPTIRFLGRLDKKEKQRFLRWLESGLFHSRKALRPLANLVVESGKRDEIELEKQWKETGQSAQFRVSLSHLGVALEKFLATEEMLGDPYLMHRYTVLALEQKQFREAGQKMRTKGAALAKNYISNPQDRLLYDFLNLRDQLDGQDTNNRKDWEGVPNQIAPFGRSIDRLFIFHKLQQACRIAHYEQFYETSIQLPFLKGLVKQLDKHPEYLDRRVLRFLYFTYLTLSEQQVYARKKAVNLLFEQTELLQFPLGKEIFIYLLNHGIGQLNKGNEDYLPINLDLYEIGLRTGLLFRNYILSGITFQNIFFLAIKLRRLDWADDFLKTYHHRLSKRDQNTIYPYCLANWHYERNDLEKASEMLYHFDGGGNASLQLQVRITLAKVYYDQAYLDLLYSHLNSTIVFISRNESLGYHGEIYLSFIRLLKKLLHRPLMPSNAEKEQLSAEILTVKVKSLRDWLLERV